MSIDEKALNAFRKTAWDCHRIDMGGGIAAQLLETYESAKATQQTKPKWPADHYAKIETADPEKYENPTVEQITNVTQQPDGLSEVDINVGAKAIIESEHTSIKMLEFRAVSYAKACAEAWGVKWK